MRNIIEDLEALKELNDELEESHIENEKQLQAEIGTELDNNIFKWFTRLLNYQYLYSTDHKDILIRDYLKRLEMADETNADYENTINQFRELVANLQRYNPIGCSLIYTIFNFLY